MAQIFRGTVIALMVWLITPAAAKAGLGVEVLETGGIYSFKVMGAEITTVPRPANFSSVASPFNYTVDFFNAPSFSKGANFYLFAYDEQNLSFDFVRNLSGAGFLSGTFDPDSRPPLGSTLKVFDTGLIELDIFSTFPTDSPCYTGLEVVNAGGAATCSKFLNSLTLTFNTGVTGKVSGGPASTTINSLLADFKGVYSGTGRFSAGGGESTVNYSVTATPVPAPGPLLGAVAAFKISRRIRRRIGSSHVASPEPTGA